MSRVKYFLFVAFLFLKGQLLFSQIILEVAHDFGESDFKWYNKAKNDNVVIGTDYYLFVDEPGVYFATYKTSEIEKNASNYFVLTSCEEDSSKVMIDLKSFTKGEGIVSWDRSGLKNSFSPVLTATSAPRKYSPTWKKENNQRELPEFTIMCLSANSETTNEIIKLSVQNVVTPNNDGINDYLKINNVEHYTQNKLEIVNRWGGIVYSATGYDNNAKSFKGFANKAGTWNRNEKLPTGTYYYKFHYKLTNVNRYETLAGYLYIKN